MKRPKLVNLLDDFSMGGVSKGMSVFDTEAVRAVVDARVEAIRPGAIFAECYDADIIVIHFPPNWQRLIYVSSLRWRNPRARIVWVEHAYTAAWEAANVPHRARFRATLRLAFRMADQVVCVSHAQARWLAEATGMALEAIEVIHPWSLNPGLADVPAVQRRSGAPLRIGAYGRLAHVKGFDLLIRAHREGLMPGTELIIGGAGLEEENLRALASGARGITFHGLVTDVAAFLSYCDAVAVPSRWEAWGQVANEAREAGRPILVAPVDGLVEQVGPEGPDQPGLVVDFTSDARIANAINILRASDLAAMGAAGRASTQGCAEIRQRQWAHLFDRLLTARETALVA